MSYDHKTIEAKWQERWESEKVFQVTDDRARPKFYNLCMYPYPSGAIHQGHVRNYTFGDLLTRYYTMKGFNVLSPMGWDSFGLPAENAAIDSGLHPKLNTENQIATMTAQIKQLGAMYDWSRELASHSTEFYRWDQWLFLELYDRGLAYKAEAPVNWCPKDQTVLANEQVIDGRCERCGTAVEQRFLDQWFFRITDFAERLLANLDDIDWSASTKTLQRNWIGRSEGAELIFETPSGKRITVFTTRPDTVFGATYLVLAPEHPFVDELTAVEQRVAVKAYQREVQSRDIVSRRVGDKTKTGVFIGSYARNPATGEAIPIWIADYVLMEYGTGAIMAVPAHDKRDFEFATQFKLPIRQVVETPGEPLPSVSEDGTLMNSGAFDGMPGRDAASPGAGRSRASTRSCGGSSAMRPARADPASRPARCRRRGGPGS